MLTAPPRFTPGADSAFWMRRGTLTRMVALQIDVVNRGQKPAGQDALAQVGVVDRNGHGGLVVAIDHSGHSPGATLCPCGPLAA
jgi:hypothetical protein